MLIITLPIENKVGRHKVKSVLKPSDPDDPASIYYSPGIWSAFPDRSLASFSTLLKRGMRRVKCLQPIKHNTLTLPGLQQEPRLIVHQHHQQNIDELLHRHHYYYDNVITVGLYLFFFIYHQKKFLRTTSFGTTINSVTRIL